ncbi:XRE family transcriptional regulator [Rhodospirillum rubrum]|uniref:cupin domain-containing protein n=1 Tax=Rhodospirillum rubrum TaxID=1085 RepID=UPI0019044330|nr:cupin domain-containing protein [Rhodospirillum rubrum]MBK1664779.1 XRE family transcriptional regulator [Rhodospirillum rubrum]MBK1676627.1 XRE family transcriptional regulator [Rhodospirillum rubrum]
MDFDVGARLRAIREAKALSQRELARRAGVTNGTISLIEQNHSSPSVASLRKVLQGIPMTLAEFFSQETPPPDQIVFRPHELAELTNEIQRRNEGAISFRQVGDTARHGLQILHETYAPGADTGRTMLAHASEEGGIVISGQIELTVDTTRYVLGPGDSYLFDSKRPHRFRNPFDAPCVIVSACTPPYL